MKIHVKILKGDECIVEAAPTDKVSVIKHQVQDKLNVPYSCQRLVHRGKPLSDDWTLKQCGIRESTKLFLVVKKDDIGGTSSDCSSSRLNLWDELHYFLLKHYRPSDARMIMDHFKQDFQGSINSLSLDDIERMGSLHLKQSPS